MKKLAILLLTCLVKFSGFAAHITGGEMVYIYLGPGDNPNTKKYRITLNLFRDQFCTGCAAMPGNVFIGIFDNDNNQQYPGSQPFDIQKQFEGPVTILPLPDCISNPPALSYNIGVYTMVIDLPNNNNGYTASYQTCCRVNPLANVFNTTGGGGTGSTYLCNIPGNNQLLGETDSSPQFITGISVVCHKSPFELDFSAEDPDGDSLVYEFCNALAAPGVGGSAPVNPSAPPYSSVQYINGYNGLQPLGDRATIDPQTGMITGFAPDIIGKYVVSVCVTSYRAGRLISSHRKDFIVNVNGCTTAQPVLEPSYTSCDGFDLTFVNLNPNNLIQTYFWDFGVPGITSDTSTQASPTFTYPDTGVYTVKLVVNKGLACSDSTITLARVFPGFFPGFIHTGACFTSPVQFTDTSKTRYGVVNGWRWDFGDVNTLADTSLQQNPTYLYPSPGTKTVTLRVTSSKGCSKTVTKDITLIDKPVVNTIFKDTLICSIDTLALNATTSSGNVTWSPNYNIINPNSLTPLVYPKQTTWYKVTANDQGCTNTDSVRVRVKDFVTVDVMPDTAICFTDSIILRTVSDGLSFRWDNAATLNNPNIKQPTARPLTTTTYTVIANIGKCESSDMVTVTGSNYPTVNAGPDTTICFGFEGQLFGSIGGATFSWSPLTGLFNSNTLTPTARPVRTTTYVLTTVGSQFCPKPARDTVVVKVIPKVIAFAGRDTLVVSGQPLQLNASGATNYQWSPPTGLNDANIRNPIATLTQNQRYVVRASTNEGCFDTAGVNIVVFKTAPDIFVPTAFSPNADGLNDVLLPVAVGLKGYDFFEVYNRWGVRMFSTTQIGRGWDGTYRNTPQDSDTFVWVVQGTDFTGKRIFKKGTVVLIR